MKYRIELRDQDEGELLDEPAAAQRYPTFYRASAAATLAARRLAQSRRVDVGIRIFDDRGRLALQSTVSPVSPTAPLDRRRRLIGALPRTH